MADRTPPVGQKGKTADGRDVVYNGEKWVWPHQFQEQAPETSAALDAYKGGTSGLVRGVSALSAFSPRAMAGAQINTAGHILNALGVRKNEEDIVPFGIKADVATTERMLSPVSEVVGGGGADYKPETTAGRYSQQIGEFLPGAVMPGGGIGRGVGLTRNLVNLAKNTVAPAVTSQIAADLTEGSKVQPYAESLTAMLTPAAITQATNFVTGGKAATAARAASAERLKARGVNPTAGQVADSQHMRANEFSTDTGRRMIERTNDDFTRAAMRTADEGNQYLKFDLPANASPEDQMDTIFGTIGKTMDDLAGRNSVILTPQLKARLSDIAATYNTNVAAGNRVNALDDLVSKMAGDDIVNLSGGGYQYYRTQLNGIAKSAANQGDSVTVEAARDAIDALDDAMDASIRTNANTPRTNAQGQALIGEGDTSDIVRYQEARDSYRKAIMLEDALLRGQYQNITPGNLRQSSIRNERRSFSRGKGVFNSLINDASEILGPQMQYASPTAVQSGTVGMGDRLAAGAVAGAPLMAMGVDPATATAAGAAGAVALPPMRNNLIVTPFMQELLKRRRQQFGSGTGSTVPGILSTLRE